MEGDDLQATERGRVLRGELQPVRVLYKIPYVQYEDETIYFSNESDVVHSLMRRFDDVWMDATGYPFYANAITRGRW